MWPLLLERAQTDAALILRMEEQHERIAELHDRVRRRRRRCSRRPPTRRTASGWPTP